MIGMLRKFLSQDAPSSAKEIKVIFPVVEHSFIPPDRIFGHIKSEVKKHSTLLTDKDYINIIGSHATVIRLGKDCPVLEWKEAVSPVVKEPGQEESPLRKKVSNLIQLELSVVTSQTSPTTTTTITATPSDTEVRPRGRPRKTPLVPEDASKSYGGPSSGSRFDASQPRPVTMENQPARRKEVTNPPNVIGAPLPLIEYYIRGHVQVPIRANLLLPSVEGRTTASSRIEDHVDHEVRGVGYIAILGRMTHFDDNYKVWAVGSTAAMDRTMDFN
uniref:Uncharacterized protein n=1 Tax=Timema shepardi TaxID=629360 RepID=A0A7R9B5W5_TIMSH|nr:unnamed protein product [Timema shepardi]